MNSISGAQMPNPVDDIETNDGLLVGEVADTFGSLVSAADAEIEQFLLDHTNSDGVLELSTEAALEFQTLLVDQSLAAQTGTNTIKTFKDNILAAARNM